MSSASVKSYAFVIKRDLHPEYFAGFNGYGLSSWTSHEPDALRVPSDQIAPTMERILSLARVAVPVAAHLSSSSSSSSSKPSVTYDGALGRTVREM